MTVQLVLNARTIGFRPEIYEVKEQYYNELKAFVSWPLRVVGVGGSPELYQIITDRNSEYLVELYCRSEDMFKAIAQVAQSFKIWEDIAALDVEALEDKLTNDQMSQALNSLKEKKDSVDRIPNETKVSTITIELSQFKSSLNTMLDQHIDSMIQLIRGQIKKESQDV